MRASVCRLKKSCYDDDGGTDGCKQLVYFGRYVHYISDYSYVIEISSHQNYTALCPVFVQNDLMIVSVQV